MAAERSALIRRRFKSTACFVNYRRIALRWIFSAVTHNSRDQKVRAMSHMSCATRVSTRAHPSQSTSRCIGGGGINNSRSCA